MKKGPKKSRVWVPRKVSSVAHPTRQAILACLESGPKTTVELEKELNESRYNLYHHLAKLKEEGFIKERIEGRTKIYELDTKKGEKSAQKLNQEMEQMTQLTQTYVAPAKEQESIEVQGEELNVFLASVGKKKVAKKKKFRILIEILEE